ncbi:MAG: MarR family transcriptional regulator [Lachnospiraceae bacterium]|nr:MarR family transcriptional regulator [Lachnospiraceae bacterium]
MNEDKTINDALVMVFNELMDIEAKCLISGEFTNISGNDMHIIDAIGLDEPKSMTQVAKIMNVTTGTLSKTVDALVRKKYVRRQRSEEDKRVVRLSLTDSGRRAYEHHARFHNNMIQDLKNGLTDEETKMLIQTLGKLISFFHEKYKAYI